VITEAVWHEQFAGKPDAIGKRCPTDRQI
jgi:hypothetical protein